MMTLMMMTPAAFWSRAQQGGKNKTFCFCFLCYWFAIWMGSRGGGHGYGVHRIRTCFCNAALGGSVAAGTSGVADGRRGMVFACRAVHGRVWHGGGASIHVHMGTWPLVHSRGLHEAWHGQEMIPPAQECQILLLGGYASAYSSKHSYCTVNGWSQRRGDTTVTRRQYLFAAGPDEGLPRPAHGRDVK